MTTRLIICDGIVGSGKSSTADFLARYLQFKGIPAKFSGEDGPLRIHALHRPPRASIPPEYIPGEPLDPSDKVKMNPEAFVEESLRRWAALAKGMASSEDVLVADGHVFHGAADQLHFLDASPQLIEDYIAQIFETIKGFDPLLVHLIRHDTNRALRETCQARGPMWTRHQVDWKVGSPYGQRHRYEGFDGLVSLFSDFSRILDRVTNRLPHRVIKADVSSGSYRGCYNDVLQHLQFPSDGPFGIASLTNEGRDVVIMGETGARASLPLAGQETVGNLFVRLSPSPEGLEPLCDVTKIEGHFYLISNSGFHNLEALSKLRTVDGSVICYGNQQLESLDFPSLEQFNGNLFVMSNPKLRRVENVGSPEQLDALRIGNNASLTDFSGLQTLQFVTGSVAVSDSKQLKNLKGLSRLRQVGGDLELSYSNAIKDMDGLQNLEEIGGDLKIIQNHNLQDLSQLGSLAQVRAVYILENPNLSKHEIHGFVSRLRARGFSGTVTVQRNGSDYDPAIEMKWLRA